VVSARARAATHLLAVAWSVQSALALGTPAAPVASDAAHACLYAPPQTCAAGAAAACTPRGAECSVPGQQLVVAKVAAGVAVWILFLICFVVLVRANLKVRPGGSSKTGSPRTVSPELEPLLPFVAEPPTREDKAPGAEGDRTSFCRCLCETPSDWALSLVFVGFTVGWIYFVCLFARPCPSGAKFFSMCPGDALGLFRELTFSFSNLYRCVLTPDGSACAVRQLL